METIHANYYSIDVYFNSPQELRDIYLPIKVYSRLVGSNRGTMRESPVKDAEIKNLTDSAGRALSNGIRENPSSTFVGKFTHAFVNCTVESHQKSVLRNVLPAASGGGGNYAR